MWVSIQEIQLVIRLVLEFLHIPEQVPEREPRPTLVRQPVLVLLPILEIVRQTLLVLVYLLIVKTIIEQECLPTLEIVHKVFQGTL